MDFHDSLYLFILGPGVIFSGTWYFMLRKSIRKLPKEWQKSGHFRGFHRSVLFLNFFLFINFIGEILSVSLSHHGICNGFIISINLSLALPFLFGFFAIHTQTPWKKYSYLVLYLVLPGYLVIGGYYHPKSIFSGTPGLVYLIICFIGTLIHLSDLLLNPRSDYFKFKLKIDLNMLLYTLLAIISTSFYLYNPGLSELIFYIHFYNIVVFYFLLALTFMIEILKLRRV